MVERSGGGDCWEPCLRRKSLEQSGVSGGCLGSCEVSWRRGCDIEGVRLEIESGRKGVLEDASQFFFEWDPKVMLETVGLRWDATFGRFLVSN